MQGRGAFVPAIHPEKQVVATADSRLHANGADSLRPAASSMDATFSNLAIPAACDPAKRRSHFALLPSNPYLYGIKFGLAGILAVFVSLVLRIEEPGWALITVFVLMVAKFLGAIAEKSVFRVMGTITGGILGYLITGAFQQNPVVFLGLVFVVLAFCTAMFGQNRYPYAFFLCGLTLVVVCANGMGNPDFSWRYALWRTEEVFVGVLSVLLVQSVIFPRFAREAFIGRACAAFGDLEGCFRRSAAILFAGPDREAVARAEGFPERLHALRNLLVFGSRESLAFRSRLGGYLGLVDALTGIAHAISTMDKTLPGDSPYRTRVGGPLEGVIRAVSGSLTRLAGGRMPDPAAMAAMRGERDRAFAALEETLLQMRNDPAVARISIDDAMAMGAHLAALETIRSALDATGGHLRALAAAGEQRPATRAIEPSAPAIPSRPWLRNGIKSAAATVTAMVLANWLQPPGATLFILATWIFTAMNPMSPSGRGDLGAWSTVLKSGLALIVYAGFLVIAAPMLASYAALNVVLFAWLFLWGTLSERREGFTVPMQLSLLCAFGVVGINAQQQPVPFQSIADIFFGLMMALVLATLFSRTFAPNLPQRELRVRLVELTGLCRQLLDGCSLAPWERTRLAILPGECATRLALLRPPCFPAPQTALLGRCTSLLARAGQDLLVVHRPARFPEHLLKRGTSIIDRIHTRMRGILDDMQQSFRGNPPGKADDSLRAELRNLRDLTAETRTWMLARGESVAETTRFLGHIACIDRCATTLLDAGKICGQIHLDALDADHRL